MNIINMTPKSERILNMKKFISIFLIMLCFVSCNNGQIPQKAPKLVRSSPVPGSIINNISTDKENSSEKYTPINYDEQKAVWISYIDLQPMLLNKSEQQFTDNISTAFEKIKALGLNTVYIHVRSFGDAYYNSEYYPYSKDINGEIDTEPDFDPLSIMIDEAHKQKLSIHAWINPMRCETETNLKKISDDYILKQWYNDPKKYDEYMVKCESDNHYWLNPAVEDVRTLIANGVKEIVKNYNVDGIHIDDYFYPTTDTYFDSGIYVEQDIKQPLSEWRKDNVSKMVKEIYDSVKSENNKVLFGVSPQGNIENNYDYMYADVKKWCSETGYLDYIVPQIYFGFNNSTKPFEQTTKDWSSIVTNKDIKLVIGLGMYKIFEEDEFKENEGIIAEQIKASKNIENYGGFSLYNYINLFEPNNDIAERTNAELKHIKKEISN